MKYELASPAQILPGTQAAVGRATGFLASAFDAPFVWLERFQDRRRLVDLDDHMLRDIGLTRAQAEEAAARPFWRA